MSIEINTVKQQSQLVKELKKKFFLKKEELADLQCRRNEFTKKSTSDFVKYVNEKKLSESAESYYKQIFLSVCSSQLKNLKNEESQIMWDILIIECELEKYHWQYINNKFCPID